MQKWECARYLIDAKKNIDSLMYIALNLSKLSNIDVQEKCDNLRQKFYINVCIVLDEAFSNKKKEICKNDDVIKRIYYERDKNAAHKDKEYRSRKYNSLEEEIEDKKTELIHVLQICKDVLPENITLDFVPHDKELFRLVHRLNDCIENDVNTIKYPSSVFHSYQLTEEGKQSFKEFNTEKYDRSVAKMFGYDYDEIIEKRLVFSVDDIKEMTSDEKSRAAVSVANGINVYEGIQNRQDFCIKINVLHNQNVWFSIDKKHLEMLERLKEIGFYDEFELIHMEIFRDDAKRKKVIEILEKYK